LKLNFKLLFIFNRQKATTINRYFETANASSAKYSQWTSDRSFNTSMQAYTKQQEESFEQKEAKRNALKERQLKLQLQFDRERDQQQTELKQLRINGKENSFTLDAMKLKSERIKTAREADRKKEAEQKLYEHWRANNPELRELTSRQLESHVASAWSDQINEKDEQQKMEAARESEFARYMDLEKQRAADIDLEQKKKKLEREIELREILKQQMIELKQREAESDILQREESQLIEESYKLSMANDERQRLQQRTNREEYGRQLLSQHKAKLRQKTKEIQEQLDFDIKVLQSVAQSLENEKHLITNKRLQAQSEAEKMIQVLNDQLRLEKEREIELDALFQEEAQKEWAKRSIEWERESEARETLMKQVLKERQLQIEERRLQLEDKKIESMERREELIKDMEHTQQLARRERERLEEAKVERRHDIQSQITHRLDIKNENETENIINYEEKQMKDEMESALTQQEKDKQQKAQFQPKVNHFFY
jgi:trichoplein keratin filament-binding protein